MDSTENAHSVQPSQPAESRAKRLFWVGALGAFVLLVLAGPGYRWSLWSLPTAFVLVTSAAALGALTVAAWIALFLIARRRRASFAAAALAGFCVAVPASLFFAARHYPRIHDITTDTTNPPRFAAVAPIRGTDSNSIDYDESVALEQRGGYPELQPLIVNTEEASFERLFDNAHYTLEVMGLDIVDANREKGRIEATATSFWFGFKDDVVVRLRSAEDATVLDIRSVSRIGQSDLGANAKRVRKFLFRMKTYKIR